MKGVEAAKTREGHNDVSEDHKLGWLRDSLQGGGKGCYMHEAENQKKGRRRLWKKGKGPG